MRSVFLAILNSLLLFLAPVVPLLISVGIAILADTVFGISASIKRGIPFSSGTLRKGLVPKMLGYQLAVLSFFFIDRLILSEFTLQYIQIDYLLTKVLAIGLIWIEIESINESTKMLWKVSMFEKVRGILKTFKKSKKEIDGIYKK